MIVPDNWKPKKVGELFEVQQGKQVSAKNRTGKHPYPFLRTKNVLWGEFDLEELDEMDFTPAEQAKLDLRPGDILVCEGGEIGRSAVWRGEVENCSFQNHLHRLRRKPEAKILPEFFVYWMQAAHLLLGTYAGRGNNTTIANLSASRLRAYTLPVPAVEEQEVIVTGLGSVEDAIQARRREVELLGELFRAFLEEVMTGQRSALPLVDDGQEVAA